SRQAIEKLPGRIGEPVEFRDEVTITVDRAKIVEACRYLKKDCAFDMLVDLSGVDNYGTDPRYEVVYELCSLSNRVHLRLKVTVSEDDLIVDSVTGVWRTADWHEREAFDMFGIRFRNHPNLKRILMWDGYPYHPLRKDFPLSGMETELPETAVDAGKVQVAAMLGGPFVTAPGAPTAASREPRQNDTAGERHDNKGAS
ncbi:MAG: NADH-quinone oxidoreductase subunit C, partial [Verrucomicrobiota bacterium]